MDNGSSLAREKLNVRNNLMKKNKNNSPPYISIFLEIPSNIR